MKPIYVLLIALTTVLVSCEQETTLQTQKDTNLIISTATQNNRAFIRRGKIKKKQSFGYRTVVVVENNSGANSENEVASIEVTLSEQNGIIPNPATIILLPKSTNANGYTRFVHNRLNFEGEDPIGQSLDALVVQKNAQGEIIEEPEVFYMTVQDNDMINMTTPNLKMNNDGETFTFKMAATGSLSGEVANVNVTLTPDDGGSDADPEQFDLELIRETENRRVFKARNVSFVDPGNVIDMQYLAAVAFYDGNGEELDYAEFRITGLERAIETPTIFGTPTLNFINDLQQFGVTIPVDGPDNTAVNDVSIILEPLDGGSATVENQMLITEFEETPTGRVFKVLISFEDPENVLEKQYNVKVEDWECEDNCLETKDDNVVCGETDHF